MNNNNRNNSNNNGSGSRLVLFLIQLQVCVRMFHWQTRSYAEHTAAGGLFDKIVQLTDSIIERYMGVWTLSLLCLAGSVRTVSVLL